LSDAAPKFRREPAGERREALIEAALVLVAQRGVRGATVRAIAEHAQVTQGLIRHYFSSKEDLMSAAYACHMERMTALTCTSAGKPQGSARGRLGAFVTRSLMPPVVDPSSVSLWAGFLNTVREDARMRSIHEQTYRDFRDRLEALISDALREAKVAATPRALRRLAIACNAVIDGLWMEGGALPDAFMADELPEIGVKSVGAIIGIDLTVKEERL